MHLASKFFVTKGDGKLWAFQMHSWPCQASDNQHPYSYFLDWQTSMLPHVLFNTKKDNEWNRLKRSLKK